MDPSGKIYTTELWIIPLAFFYGAWFRIWSRMYSLVPLRCNMINWLYNLLSPLLRNNHSRKLCIKNDFMLEKRHSLAGEEADSPAALSVTVQSSYFPSSPARTIRQ